MVSSDTHPCGSSVIGQKKFYPGGTLVPDCNTDPGRPPVVTGVGRKNNTEQEAVKYASDTDMWSKEGVCVLLCRYESYSTKGIQNELKHLTLSFR